MSELSSFHNGATSMLKIHLDFSKQYTNYLWFMLDLTRLANLTTQNAIYFELQQRELNLIMLKKNKKLFYSQIFISYQKNSLFFLLENTTNINVLLKNGKAMSIYIIAKITKTIQILYQNSKLLLMILHTLLHKNSFL